MSYISRAKTIIKEIRRFDAVDPTNAELAEYGQAVLYHPKSGPIWDVILIENGLVLNPDNEQVLDDIGTLDASDPPVFTPASTSVKNSQIANLFRRNIRAYLKDVFRAHRLNTANATIEPLPAATATIKTVSDVDSTVIVGDDSDDPES